MTLDMTKELLSSRLLQERYTCVTVIGTNINIKQHATPNNICNLRMCGAFWEIGKQKGSFGKLVELLTLGPRLGLVRADSIEVTVCTVG